MSQYSEAIDQILPRHDVGFEVMLMELCDILFVRETDDLSRLELWLQICRKWGSVDSADNGYTFLARTYYTEEIGKRYAQQHNNLLHLAFHLKHEKKMDFKNAMTRIWLAIISHQEIEGRVFAVRKILQGALLPYDQKLDSYLPDGLHPKIDKPKADYLSNFRRTLKHLIFISDAVGANTSIVLLKAYEDYHQDKEFLLLLMKVYHHLICEFLEKQANFLAEGMVEAQQRVERTTNVPSVVAFPELPTVHGWGIDQDPKDKN